MEGWRCLPDCHWGIVTPMCETNVTSCGSRSVRLVMTPAARSPATPGETRQALILDGLFGRVVVSFGRVSGLPWGHGWHLWVVIWAPVGPMKALTRHDLLVGTFWATGWPKKASKRHGAPKPFLHIFTKEVDEFHRFLVDVGLTAAEPQRTLRKTKNIHISNGF